MVCDTAVYERHHGSGILARQKLSDRETRLHIAVWKKAVVDEREVDFRLYLAEVFLSLAVRKSLTFGSSIRLTLGEPKA